MGNISWTIEILVLCLSLLVVLISIGITRHSYLQKKIKHLRLLPWTWYSLAVYQFFVIVAKMFLSPFLYRVQIVFIIVFFFFISLLCDDLTQAMVKPYKMLIFGLLAGVTLFSLFDPASIVLIPIDGELSIHTEAPLAIWILPLTLQSLFLFSYYTIKINRKIVQKNKLSSVLLLLGGIIFGPLSVIAFIFLTIT